MLISPAHILDQRVSLEALVRWLSWYGVETGRSIPVRIKHESDAEYRVRIAIWWINGG